MKKNFSTIKSYSLAGVENTINGFIRWVFFYRLFFVLLAVLVIFFAAGLVLFQSSLEQRASSLVVVFTGGSVVIGIFYAILNYEINYNSYQLFLQQERKISAYQAVTEWRSDFVVQQLRRAGQFYEKHQHLIQENRFKEFSKLLDGNDDARAALLSVFNFWECVALGVNEGIHDEQLIKNYFRGILLSFYNDYEVYISFKRKVNSNPAIWIQFTMLAERWRNE